MKKLNNLVAKNVAINKAATYRDRKNDYTRKGKRQFNNKKPHEFSG